MGSHIKFSIFVSLIFIPLILATDLRNITINEISKLQAMSIDEYIDYVNPLAVHKFKNGNGDSIHCVKYEDQISLRLGIINKGLRQMSRDTFKYNSSSVKECPEGTVPIIEITHERVKRAGSVRQFLNRKSSVLLNSNNHEWAIVDEDAEEVHQSKAVFNVWQPFVQSADFFSLGQMWLLKDGPDETMEAGLQVFPGYYGDGFVRFFVFFSLDRYNITCYNLECSGFIQEGQQFYPGMIIDKVSVYEGEQQESTISIRRETRGNNIVWAVYLQNILVGHWPAILFKNLTLSANRVQFGGEVSLASAGQGIPHSKTDMGSGHFPSNFSKSAYIRNIQLFTTKDALITKRKRKYIATNQNCYDVKGHVKNDDYWGDFIFYGGPGGDVAQCKN